MTNPADVQVYLEGINYPADKESVIRHAESKGAPEEVLTVLEYISDREYADAADISSEFGGVDGMEEEGEALE